MIYVNLISSNSSPDVLVIKNQIGNELLKKHLKNLKESQLILRLEKKNHTTVKLMHYLYVAF